MRRLVNAGVNPVVWSSSSGRAWGQGTTASIVGEVT